MAERLCGRLQIGSTGVRISLSPPDFNVFKKVGYYKIVITKYLLCYYYLIIVSKEFAKIRKIGNGRGILLPKSLCNILEVDIEDILRVETNGKYIKLIPVNKGEDEIGA
jgi:hypothetical protein